MHVTKITMQFLFIILFLQVVRSEIVYTNISPDSNNNDQIANGLLVKHFDCENPKNTRRYALNYVDECRMAEDDFEVNDAHFTIYQKLSGSKKQCNYCYYLSG